MVVLVTAVRLNPFLALLAAALFVGAGAGKPMLKILQAFQDGLGATLAGTAAVIGLGTMLGTLLAQSRGAEVLAQRFAAFFGPPATCRGKSLAKLSAWSGALPAARSGESPMIVRLLIN